MWVCLTSILLRGICQMRHKKTFSYLLLALVGFASLVASPSLLQAKNDTRTISFYETHLRETTTITYKRNGKFIPKAMKRVNYALRDWRTGQPTRMNPKLIDTIWELYQELGAKGSVQIISGYRSPKTNAKLRRRGGGQAKRSQHTRGNAMDVRFSGVSTKRLREAAMKKERGGVGYYPSSRFVHVDVARVRAWPRMSRYQLAMLFPYKSTRHRPSSGGPLNRRDRYKARIRLAKLGKPAKRPSHGGDHSHGGTFLAQAKKPGNTVVANNTRLAAARSGLWVNAANNQRYAALDDKVLDPPKIQKAAATPDKSIGLGNKIKDILSEFAKGYNKDKKDTGQPAAQLASLTEGEADMDEFRAQKVGYAPIYNDEDPEEVAFQPFSISPIIGGQHSGLKEPAYNKLDLADGNMIFSARFKRAIDLNNTNWSSEFRGKAVRNLIGRQAGLKSAASSYMKLAARQ